MIQLLLSPNAYVCSVDNRYIFLDLIKDKYLSLTDEKAALFTQLHRGAAELTPGHKSLIAGLQKAGIITACGATGKAIEWPTCRATDRDIHDFDVSCRVAISDYVKVFGACAKASFLLRYRSILPIVEQIKAGKAAARHHPIGTRNDIASLARLFYRLRPIYPHKPICLHDSIALYVFLNSYGYYPDWVFGVTAEPFHAHCWLQQGGIVLNDSLDSIGRYTPIMVV